jgi:predicted metal-dependent HD superfamily phosphohydrolase
MADSTRDQLLAYWLGLFDGPAHGTTFDQLVDAYSAPSRHYHNLRHVRDCLDQMKLCVNQLADPRALAAAIWFHDAVYDPTRPDNEARSADLADQYLRTMNEPEEFIAKVHDLILDTRHTAPPTTPDGQYLVDIDLSILGRDGETFDAYDGAIRREYAHVPEPEYRIGRAKVLRSFLSREFIYHTPTFRDLYESPARANLARTIARLTTPHSTAGS